MVSRYPPVQEKIKDAEPWINILFGTINTGKYQAEEEG